MALVSGIGAIYPHEHARIHPIPGKSRHVKVLGVTTWEDFPLAALGWWEKQEPTLVFETIPFLKVQWLSVAGGEDGTPASRNKTLTDPPVVELILRKETGVIPAFAITDIIIVYHADELEGLIVKGMTDVFCVAAREVKGATIEPLPLDEHTTFPQPMDYLGEPIVDKTLTFKLWNTKVMLRGAIHKQLITNVSSVPVILTPFDSSYMTILYETFEGAKYEHGVKTKTHYTSDHEFVARKRVVRVVTDKLIFTEPEDFARVTEVLGEGWEGIINRRRIVAIIGAGDPEAQPEDSMTMRMIRPPLPDGAGGVALANEAGEADGAKPKRPCPPPGLRLVWDPIDAGSLSVRASFVSGTWSDVDPARAAAPAAVGGGV